MKGTAMRFRSRLPIAIIAALLAAAPSLAAEGAAQDGKKKEAKICRSGEETGTRVAPSKICKTEIEWQKFDAAGGDRGNGRSGPAGESRSN
jgi:hypothetical protein